MKKISTTGMITNPAKCTGCASCTNICPVSAIAMQEDEMGFLRPVIDDEKCMHCDLCKRICPIENPPDTYAPEYVFAAWAKNKEEHDTSTSGGVAAVFSRYILNHKGIVYGAAFNRGCSVSHRRIDSDTDLPALKGSKYVQSTIGMTYQSVRNDLQNGSMVLFTGTPCQVAGLKNYLQKPYDNLFTIDLVCHGVPSQKLLRDHIESLGFICSDVDAIRFRENDRYFLSVLSGGKSLYKKDDLHDIYYAGFNDCLYLRDSCICCDYAKAKRVGDISVGDFHGLGREKVFDAQTDGLVSLLMINTSKGLNLFERCKGNLTYYSRTLDEAKNGNEQLNHPSRRRGDYKRFCNLYQKEGFEKAAKKTLRIRRIKNMLLSGKRALEKAVKKVKK